MNEVKLAEETLVLLSKLGTWFTVAGIAYVLVVQMKATWGDILIHFKMRYSDNPRFTPTKRSGVQVEMMGRWWTVEEIGAPIIGSGNVELKTASTDDECISCEQMDVGLYEYYKGKIPYKIGGKKTR